MTDQAASGNTLKDIAVVTRRGGDIEEDETLKGAAWRVYSWIRAKAYAQERDNEHKHEGVMGFRWIGQYQEPFYDLWTAGASPLPGVPVDIARSTVRDYLINSGNLVVLERGGPRTPTLWWGKQDYEGEIPGDESAEEARTAPAQEPASPPDGNEEVKQYPCHEPECWASPFISVAQRVSHENTYHYSSKWRVYACTVDPACSATFYEWHGLANHVSRYHGIKRSIPQFETVKNNAEAEAARILAKLRPARPVPVTDVWEEKPVSRQPVPVPAFNGTGEGTVTPDTAVQFMNSLIPPAPAPAPAPAPQRNTPDWDGSFGTLQVFINNMQAEFSRLQRENAELRQENGKLRTQLTGSVSRVNLGELREYLTEALALLGKEGNQ